MFHTSLSSLFADLHSILSRAHVTITSLLITNLFFNILANASFKVSIANHDWSHFLVWQIIGNLAGFITVLTLTGLLLFIPLHVAFPITTGLAVIGVQIASAKYLFSEPVSAPQWLGTILIVVGILLIGAR